MRFFSLSSERIPFLITLAIVISLGAGYYFIYVPENESDVKQWKFRSLENIGRNVQSKIRIGHKQLNTYLLSENLVYPDGKLKDSVNIFLKSLATENLPISQVTALTADSSACDALIVSSMPGKLILTDTVTRNRASFRLSLTYDFDQFIRPLLTDQVFDQYMVVRNDTVLYETFFSGQSPCKDSLFMNCGKLRSATMAEREYAGIMYKLFILPIDLNADTRILLTGLLTADHYDRAKTRLPTRLVLFLVTLFTGILVTFPIIKLYQLSGEDRLTLKDVVSVTIVSMLLLSIIFLCFVKYSSMFFEDKQEAKLNLANTISTSFVQEIKENYVKLDTLNSWIERKPQFQHNFYGLGRRTAQDLNDSLELCLIDSAVKDIGLDRIFWMGKNGVEFRTWTSGGKGLFPGRFDQRDYFKNIKNRTGYSLEGLPKSQLYVDQIVSWVSGDFLTVIAKPSRYDTAQVSAILFRAQSLKKAKIPPGYSFAVIDQNGRVLYHSDTTKNLNENLFDEFSDERNLQANIKTGSFQPFKTRYFGKEFHVQMRPVGGGLPYYVVILESLMFEEYRDLNVYSFTLSMQLLLFFVIIIQALALFFASARKSSYKSGVFETSWLGPKSSGCKQYLFAGTFNISQLLILCFLFRSETLLNHLLMLLASVTLMPVFLNILFYDAYKKEEKELGKLKKRAAGVGLLFTFFLNLIAAAVLSGSLRTLLFFELIVVIFGAFLRYFHSVVLEKNGPGGILSYQRNYAFMLVSWMFVSMGFSVMLFFRAAYNYEQHLVARYMQLELADANTIDVSRRLKADGGSVLTSQQKEQIINSFYKDHYWVDAVWFSRGKPKFGSDDEPAINLLRSFHLYSNENIPPRINLNNPGAFDFSFYFNNLIRQEPNEKSASLTYYRILNDDYLVIKSAALRFQLPLLSQFRGIFPWLIFVMLLSAYCMVIFGLIRKVFSLAMAEVRPSEAFDFAGWLAAGTETRIFLVDLSSIFFSGSHHQNQNPVSPDTIKLDLAEMPVDTLGVSIKQWESRLAAAREDRAKPIILENFEHNFKNAATSNAKLILMEKLIRNNSDRKLLVRSAIQPSTMLTALNLTPERDAMQTAERWHSLLGNYKIIINPLAENYFQENTANSPHLKREAGVFESYTTFYHGYFSIWQSLSDQEKFMLYDLAEDGLVNSYDRITFRQLIRKGIIKSREGRFKLFSKGFRSFILSGLNQGELSGIMAKINDNANWNRIRMPLVLISLAILIFIISSQREASTKLLTTLGALATAIPALINLLSSVSGNSNKKSAS